MKLIKLADDVIYDVDTGILYTLFSNSVTVTASTGTQDMYIGKGKEALWGWLEDNASNESYRNIP